MGGYCLLLLLLGACTLYGSYGIGKFRQNETATLIVDANAPGRTIPDTLFGIFFEVILFELLVLNLGFKWIELSLIFKCNYWLFVLFCFIYSFNSLILNSSSCLSEMWIMV